MQLQTLASEFHDRWRRGRLNEQGIYEPRFKTTQDQAWIEAHGTDQVDIASTSFENLPSDWRSENLAAAKVALEMRGVVGRAIHEAWLNRHPEAKGSELDKPFDSLSPQEQAKDLDQEEIALML